MLMMEAKLFDSIICKSIELLKADDARKSEPKVFCGAQTKNCILWTKQSRMEIREFIKIISFVTCQGWLQTVINQVET